MGKGDHKCRSTSTVQIQFHSKLLEQIPSHTEIFTQNIWKTSVCAPASDLKCGKFHIECAPEMMQISLPLFSCYHTDILPTFLKTPCLTHIPTANM